MLMVGTTVGTGSGRGLGVSRLATCGGGTAGAGTGACSEAGSGFICIRASPCESDGVVRVSGAEDDATPSSRSSGSMGISRGVKGEADRVIS